MGPGKRWKEGGYASIYVRSWACSRQWCRVRRPAPSVTAEQGTARAARFDREWSRTTMTWNKFCLALCPDATAHPQGSLGDGLGGDHGVAFMKMRLPRQASHFSGLG